MVLAALHVCLGGAGVPASDVSRQVAAGRARPDTNEWEGKPNKLQYFSPNPGPGD